MSKFKIIAISGSLSKSSVHTHMLHTCKELNNPKLEIEIADIHDFPLFNEDLEKQGVPVPVKALCDKVRAADAILFAVPENNGSVSAALKNAYDWLSRGQDSAVKGKLFGQISAAGQGGAAAQAHMKQIVQYCKLVGMEEPKVQIQRYAPGNFNADGSVASAEIKKQLAAYLDAFAVWIGKNKK